MPQTQISCPNCKQPVPAEVQQLFNVDVEPQDKDRLLSGAVNVVRCPHCGYQGNLTTPVVYHDSEKELLLTYFPPELNQPMEEQEKSIGPLIQKVVESLPQEKRKGYLFKPQQMFTHQTLIETVLEGEGITKEMLDAQKKRMDLLQRLLSVSEDSLEEVVKQEQENIDGEFFTLMNRLMEASQGARDEKSVQKLQEVQNVLLENTDFGQELKKQAEEIEAARKNLQDAGEGLTREKLQELLEEAAENEIRLNALVSLARPGLDYVFFQNLSERIEAAEGVEKEKLNKLREDLLEITGKIDEQLQARMAIAQQNLEALLEQEDPSEALQQNPNILDDYFIQALNQAMAKAEEDKNEARADKIKNLVDALQKLLSPGYNQALVQELVEAPNEEARKQIVAAHAEEITPEFIESLSALMLQLQESEDKETAEKVRAAYRAALAASMKKGMATQE